MNPSSHAGVVNPRQGGTAPVRRLPTKLRQPHQTHRRWTFTGADFAADTGAAAVGSARDERVAPVSALSHTDFGSHSLVGQRHVECLRLRPGRRARSGRLKMGYGLMPI